MIVCYIKCSQIQVAEMKIQRGQGWFKVRCAPTAHSAVEASPYKAGKYITTMQDTLPASLPSLLLHYNKKNAFRVKIFG